MKLFIILFALIGATYALVPGMEYEYDYEGQVKIAFPEIRNRISGTGIKFTVGVQVQDEVNVAIQLKDVQVGEYKGDISCELRQSIPLKYEPIAGHAKLLEDVFMIHPGRSQGEVMESTKSEEVWITNIKKSIASLFIVEPIRGNFGGDDRSLNMLNIRSIGHSTVDSEPSLFGQCSGDYSMVPLNNTHRNSQYPGRSSAYPEAYIGYEMSRTINFDRCNISVNTKQTSMGNTSESHLTQFGDVQSRHSVMRHNLTYDGQYYILQNGTNEGHFALNPYGMNNEKLVAYSNQTYHLRSVKKIQSRWQLPTSTRFADTWFMEAVSPFSPGPDSPDWIRYESKSDARYEPLVEEQFWTGIDLSQYTKIHKKILDEVIDNVATLAQLPESPPPLHNIGPFDTDSANIASDLEIAVRATRTLDRESLSQLFDQYYSDASNKNDMKAQFKLRIYIDTLGASGTGAPIRVLLDKLNEKKIDIRRAASLFFALPNNLISTPIITEIAEYVRSLDFDRDDPLATGIIFTNFANTINKVCVNQDKYKNTVPYQILGKEHCSDKEAVDAFLPFLEKQLKRADEEFKQVILVHAIGNIGSSRGFSVLKSIVEDERVNSTVRVAAVYAINKKKMDPSFKRFALRTFMSVADNRTDNEYVRQACILAILSWKPPRSWYQTLASNSWLENSDEMSSFTYFILKSFAQSNDPAIRQQSEVARFFLPLTKPYAPTVRYSYSRLLSIYDSKQDLVTDFDISSLRAGRYSDSVPRQVLAFLVNSFGGYRFSVAQSSLSYDARDLHSLLQKMSQLASQSWRNVRSSANRRTQLAIQDVQKRMIIRQSDSSASLATYYFSMFDDMELLLPLNKDTVSRALLRDGLQFFKEQKQNVANFTKFINPALLSLVVPTEVGLPLISRFTLPTYNAMPLKDFQLLADGQDVNSLSQLVRANEIRLDVNGNFRFASKALTIVRVLMPWTERAAVAGVEALKGANLPAKISLKLDKENPLHRNFSIGIIPTVNAKFTVAQLHTVPFVATKSMFALETPPQIKGEILIVSQTGTGEGIEKVYTPINSTFTGIVGALRYEGDVSYPFTRGNALTLLRQPNLIPALFSSPTCRLLETTVIIDMPSSETKEIYSSYALKIDTSTGMKIESSLPVFELKSTLLYNSSSETRYFETQIKNSEVSQSGQRHKSNFQINHSRSPLPHYDNNPAGYCLSLTKDSPLIKSVDDLRKVLQNSQNAEVDVKGDVTGGSGDKACENKHIASLTGNLKLSEQRRTNLSQELNSVCSYDANDPTVTFVTAPVYDRLSFDISYQDPVPKTLKNATFHLYDLIRGYAFPHVYFNYIDQNNPKNRISVRGDRYLSEKRWKLDVTMPKESSKYDNFKIPSFIEDIMPVGGVEPSPQRYDAPKILMDSHVNNRCIIKKDKIRPFDGHSYNYRADKCFAVAVRDSRSERSPEVFTGIERDILIAHVHFISHPASVVITPNYLTVDDKEVRLSHNPTEIKSSDGTVLAKAAKIDHFIQIDIPNLARVRVKNSQEITIIPSESMRDRYAGLCGNYDSQKHDLVGPQLCKYSDPELFAKSWTENVGKECSQDHYNQIHREVQSYQKNCPKATRKVVHKANVLANYGKVPADCIEYVYKIRRNGRALCVSQDIVAICYPLCKLDKPRYYNEVYDCWAEQYAPKELERNEKRGFIRHKIDRQAYVTSAFKTEHAFMCSRK